MAAVVTTAESSERTPRENPFRHDHNPLNEDFHGGICPACELEDAGIPSVDVCSFCADPECDGIGCIASLDSNESADHDTIEELHDLIRAGAAWKIMQTHGYVVAERALAHAEHRVAHEFGVEGVEPVTWREWQVISDADGGGVSFSVDVLDRDSERVAARWVRPGTHLAMAEYRRWTSPAVLVARVRHETRCPRDVGKRPSWMSPDQYDPCQCVLTAGHQPPCRCRHDEVEMSSTAAIMDQTVVDD